MNPLGDGMEFVAVSAAIMLLEIPFTIPAFILAVRGKALGVAACLAGFATFAYVIFWIQVYAEMTAKGAPTRRSRVASSSVISPHSC